MGAGSRTGIVLASLASLLVAGCGALGFDSGAPDDIAPTTSAAPVADPGTVGTVVVVPATPTTGPAASPTPWQSLTTTTETTSTSEPPQTAPTTTRTLTFSSAPEVTAPSTVAPTQVGSPPPDCYGAGTCPALDSATADAGRVEVVNTPDGATTVAVLTVGKKHAAAVLSPLPSPTVACRGSYCLVQGKKSGLYFGTLLRITDGVLRTLAGTPTSTTTLTLLSGPVVAGTTTFDDYGLWPQDAPVAARTWAVSGGELASTGCGQPVLYRTPATPGGALSGPCTGTPTIAGYGKASAHKAVQLGGFVTPSGNIACALGLNGGLICTAKKNSIKVATCSVSKKKIPKALRGLRVKLSASGSTTYDDCLGYDLIGAPSTTIAYNRIAVGGGFVCTVQQSGVTCTATSGRGFTLSSSSLTRF